MEWTEVCILTKSEAVEAITAFIYDMGVGGVSIEDPLDILAHKSNPLDWVVIDESLIKGNVEDVIIKVYFSQEVNVAEKILYINEQIKNVSKYINVGKGQVTINKVNEEDWANAWKKYFVPVKVGQKIVIKPTWEEYLPSKEDIVVELDPGMAFGTGTHETTRMCIKMLEKYVEKDSVVFDIGCGSGILGICASKLGAQMVIGVDIDANSVKVSKENVLLNNVNNIEIREGNLLDVVSEKANIVVANIISDVIIYLSETIISTFKENGVFICSGIIKDRSLDVQKALIDNKFKIIEVVNEGEWVAIVSHI